MVHFSEDKCPKCGAIVDCAGGITQNKRGPKEGDLSICIYCCTMNKFDQDLKLVKAEKADIDSALTKHPALAKLITFTQGYFYYRHDELADRRRERGEI